MRSKNEYDAAVQLVDFIRDYSVLLEKQMLGIRKTMSGTVEDVLSTIQHLGDTADKEVDKSNTIIGKNNNAQFENRSIKEVVAKEDSMISERSVDEKGRASILENRTRRIGGLFSKRVEALSNLEKEIQEIVFSLVGSLSVDDVLGQKLSHTIQSVEYLNDGISEVIRHRDGYKDVKPVIHLRNKVLTHTYRSYTNEEEKEIFHQIFGKPKRVVNG